MPQMPRHTADAMSQRWYSHELLGREASTIAVSTAQSEREASRDAENHRGGEDNKDHVRERKMRGGRKAESGERLKVAHTPETTLCIRASTLLISVTICCIQPEKVYNMHI